MRRTFALFLVAFMAMGTGLVFAEEHTVERQDRDGLTGNQYRVSEIENFGIVGRADDNLGDVQDAVFTRQGRVSHLIVDLQDVEGVEDGTYLVFLDSFRVYDADNLTLDLDRAHEFLRYSDDSDDQNAHRLSEGFLRSSDFRGWEVVGRQNDQIASMDDVVVDIGTGRVVYVTIATGGFLGIGDNHYAVAFDELQVEVAEERIRLDITEDDFERMESLDMGNWPAQGQNVAAVATDRREAEDDRDDVVVGQEADDDRDGLTGNLYRVSEIVDFGITSDSDDSIGNVVEVVIDMEGEVTHLIAHLYDLEGIESGAYLVPVSAVSLYNTESIRLDATVAQEFTRFYDGQTGLVGDTRGTPVQTEPTGEVAQDTETDPDVVADPQMADAQRLPEGAVRSSEFMDYEVVLGSSDDVVGSTYDVVVDLETNRVVYVAIGAGGILGIGRDYHAMSFDRLAVDVAERRVRLDMTEDEFAQLEGFDLSNWPREAGEQRVGAAN